MLLRYDRSDDGEIDDEELGLCSKVKKSQRIFLTQI